MKRLILGAALVTACGASQTRLSLFSTDWEDDRGASIRRLWERVGASPVPASADVVVGVSGHADRMIGQPLSGGPRWTFAHRLDARPIVAGQVVIGFGAGELFALDAQTGSVLWRRQTDDSAILGAGDDGALTAVTFRGAGGVGSVLLAVAHDGKVVRRIETDKGLGVPAVVQGRAFVPWAGQYVSVIQLDSGDETARVTLRAQTSRAWPLGGALWFGESDFIRFDEHIGDASRGLASTITLPVRELPGMPKVMASGTSPLPPQATADDKVRAYARAVGGMEGPAIEDGRWYTTYFRIAMGLDAGPTEGVDRRLPPPRDPAEARAANPPSPRPRGRPLAEAGKLVWVHLHSADLLGGAAAAGGIVLCDERGKITELDANTGGVVSEADLGETLSGCVVSVDAQRVVGVPDGVKPLAAQLAEAVLADDPQLVVAQRLLLRELATVEEDTATKALVDLVSDPRTSPELLADARKALANRRNGASYMEAALVRHYDFLKDVLRPPPVGPIAQALGPMKEKAAAPLLAAHLLDPADTDDDVMHAAAALSAIAGPGEAPALRQFFGMYRASADNDAIATAVVSVAQALLAADPLGGRATVAAAAVDSSTVPYARERLQALLSETKQEAGAGPNDSGPAEGKRAK